MKYLITQSLLSSWNYLYDCYEDYKADAKEDFLKALNREPTAITEARQDGIDFENAVIDYCKNGKMIEDKRFGDTYKQIGLIVKGGQFQATAYKQKTIDGIDFLLYSKSDCVKAGKIYDIKFTGNYDAGKFIDSPQHPMYLECIPARQFEYLISDGKDIYKELYTREDTQSIETFIRQFINDLKSLNLLNIYFEKWVAHGN